MPIAAGKHDPAAIFLVADQYRNARNYLALSTKNGLEHEVRIPAVVCAAFSLELYFKCLLMVETGRKSNKHNLQELFCLLSAITQAKIRDRFAPRLSEAEHFIALSATESKVPFPTVDFDYLLNMSKKCIPPHAIHL